MRTRGEAFESMMLVVSVVIALAILSILAALIAELQVGVATAPDQAMHDALKPIVSSGFGSSSPQKTVLWKGQTLDMKQVLKSDLPELDAGTPGNNDMNVRFCVLSHTFLGELVGGAPCSATFSTEGRTAVYGGATRLGPQANSLAFYFVACGDSTAGSRGEYMITIAGTAAEAGRNCYLAAARNSEPPAAGQDDFLPLPPLRARQPERSVPPSIEENRPPTPPNPVPQNQPQIPGPTASVLVIDNLFEPDVLVVDAGTTVVWTNDGSLPHFLNSQLWQSPSLAPRATFQRTFTNDGVSPLVVYYNDPQYQDMDGLVVVIPPTYVNNFIELGQTPLGRLGIWVRNPGGPWIEQNPRPRVRGGAGAGG